MRRRGRAFAVLVAIAVGAPALLARVAPVAHAQSADEKAAAERLFNDAKSLMERKDFDGACPKFAESLRIDPGIGVMLYLADCYEKQGKLASAWATFREANELATKQNDPKRADVAKKHAAALEPNLSMMTITVAPGADIPGLVVTRNGSPVGKPQWGTAIPVDAGPHVIAATAPNRQKWETTSHVAGDRARVTVTVPVLEAGTSTTAPTASGTATTTAPPPTASGSDAPLPPPTGGLPTQKIVALAVGGVGVIGVGLGAIFGLQASSKLSDSNSQGCNSDNHCNPTGGQLRNDALSAATISTVAFIVGAAAIAGGAVLWFTTPKTNDAPTVGLTGYTTGRDGIFVLRGSF